MKKILALFLLVCSTSIVAAPINMACVTEYPTTTFIAATENDVVNFRLFHHNGVQFMPVWSGLMTPHDLPMINEVAQILSSLGDDLNFSMPVDNCKMQDGFLMNCFGGGVAVDINEHKVTLWGVYTSQDVERSVAGEYKNIWTNLALDIDGKTYYLPMKYNEYECYKDSDNSGIKKHLRNKNLFL